MGDGQEPTDAKDLIRRRIASCGAISFAEYMNIALYDKQFGYYAQSTARIGRDGDFITNASVSSLFGRILAWQFVEGWHAHGCPPEFHIIEQGAGTGWLAKDLLDEISANYPEFFATLQFHIIEPLPELVRQQQCNLAHFPKVIWHQQLSGLGQLRNVIYYANELVDAMPVHLLESDGSHWLELRVDYDSSNQQFTFNAGAPDRKLLECPAYTSLPVRPSGWRCEVSAAAIEWLTQLCYRLGSGLILIIDYGLPRTELLAVGRSGGTLRGYTRHRQLVDILTFAGQCDLTAHVDFTMLTQTATAAGWDLAGYTDQHHFLTAAAHQRLLAWEQDNATAEIAAFKSLSHPATMGTAFQFLAFSRDWPKAAPPLSGFQFSRTADLQALMVEPKPH